ncbi:MAG: glycosyltransferase [Candidatus Cryosericum sp.]
MRIAYVIDEDLGRGTGVGTKVQTQFRIWRKFGHEVKAFSLRPQTDGAVACTAFTTKVSGKRPIARYIQRANASGWLRQQLEGYAPDIVYLRYMLYAPGLVKALSPRGVAYVVEANTDDVCEVYLKNRVFGWYNRLTRGQLLGHATAIVSVIPSLARNPAFSRFRVPIVSIPNGIDYDEYRRYSRHAAVVPESRAKLVFVGNPDMPWQGIDRLCDLASACPELEFNVIGYPPSDLDREAPTYRKLTNLVVHGKLSHEACAEVLAGCDVGISTLALYRNHMDEACPLKSRQYLAQGLPTIMCYHDPDLSDKGFPFILELPNSPTSVFENIERIKDFVERCKGVTSDMVISTTKPILGVAAKETQRLDFLQQVRVRQTVR